MKKVPTATYALGIDRYSPLNECTRQNLLYEIVSVFFYIFILDQSKLAENIAFLV